MEKFNVEERFVNFVFNSFFAFFVIFFFFLLQFNLIGRLQLSTERSQQEDNQSIVQLRILRTQEAIIKIMKMRKRLNNAALQVFNLFCFLFKKEN